jgi:hypothetical protein
VYDATLPYFTVVPEASNRVLPPAGAGVAVTFASGAWSGAIAMPFGAAVTAIAVVAAFVAVSIGVTEVEPVLATYAVAPSGVTATPRGWSPTEIAAPAVFAAASIGVTLSAAVLVT